MLFSLWGRLTVSRSRRQSIDAAKASIENITYTIHSVPFARKQTKCLQLQCFQANAGEIFKNYDLISTLNPFEAIQVLMGLEKILGPHAQKEFWDRAPRHIAPAISKTNSETKLAVCNHIFETAHIGTLNELILAQSEDFASLLEKNADDKKFIERFFNQSHPRTIEFLERFKHQFEIILAKDTLFLLGLIDKVIKPSQNEGDSQNIQLPEYIQIAKAKEAKRTQEIEKAAEAARILKLAKEIEDAKKREALIQSLVLKIKELYFCENPRYQEITGCLQELSGLKISETDLVKRVKSTAVREKNDVTKLQTSKIKESDLVYIYLYKIPVPNDEDSKPKRKIPDSLYIIATKKAGFGYVENTGVLKIVLISPDLQIASQSFQTLLYSNSAKNAVEGLVAQFTIASVSFELTQPSDSLNLSDEQPIPPLAGHPIAIQQPEHRPLQ